MPSKDDKKGGRDKSRTVIKMPVLNGDVKIWAGQAVLMLIRLANENNLTYTDDTYHMSMWN